MARASLTAGAAERNLNDEYIELVRALQQQDEIWNTLYPEYRKLIGQRKSTPTEEAATGGQAAANPSLASSRGVSLVGAIEDVNSLVGGMDATTPRRTILETSGDKRLFQQPLMSKTWDSIEASSNGKADVFIAKLEGFSTTDRVVGRNVIVLRGEYFTLKDYERVYLAVNISDTPETTGYVLCQVCFRIDPAKGLGVSGKKMMYIQGYKLATWQTKIKTYNAMTVPFKQGVPFYWRIMFHPQGVASYVDGEYVMFSPYPPGKKPADGTALYVQLPIAGDAGEKPTWRVHSMHWGSAAFDQPTIAEIQRELSSSGGAGNLVPDEVYVTGLRPAATGTDVATVFEKHGVAVVNVRSEAPGAMVVKLADSSLMSKALTTLSKGVTILDTAIHVTQAIKK